MSILIGCLYVVEVIVCLLLAMVVMLQKPKEGGLGGAIGGGMMESALGADAGSVLIKTTAILGAIFLANTLVLARLTSSVHSRSVVAGESNAPVEQQAAPDPLATDIKIPGATSEAPASTAPATAEAPELPAPETPAK